MKRAEAKESEEESQSQPQSESSSQRTAKQYDEFSGISIKVLCFYDYHIIAL